MVGQAHEDTTNTLCIHVTKLIFQLEHKIQSELTEISLTMIS